MEIITLRVNESVFDKFSWLMSHFAENEIAIVNEIDATKLPQNSFDYISESQMKELEQISKNYKNGKRDDFVEYII